MPFMMAALVPESEAAHAVIASGTAASTATRVSRFFSCNLSHTPSVEKTSCREQGILLIHQAQFVKFGIFLRDVIAGINRAFAGTAQARVLQYLARGWIA